MIRIAFCDNDLATIQELSEWTENFFKTQSQELECVLFSNSFDLLTQLESGRFFDALVLNTNLTEGYGIDIASEIRKMDQNIKIIFISSSKEYALDSYSVKAFFYLLKPIQVESYERVLKYLVDEIAKEAANGFIVRAQNMVCHIMHHQIEYCDVCNRVVSIHLVNDTVLETSMRFKELEDLLIAKDNFVRTHRFYLVNMDYIFEIRKDVITMRSGNTIPISHGNLKYIRNQFLDYYDSKLLK